MRRRRTTGENNDVGGEGKHAAQVHLTALLPQPPEVEKVRQDASTNKSRSLRWIQRGVYLRVQYNHPPKNTAECGPQR